MARKIETVTDKETEKIVAGLKDKTKYLKILNCQNLIITENLDYIFSCYKLTVKTNRNFDDQSLTLYLPVLSNLQTSSKEQKARLCFQ